MFFKNYFMAIILFLLLAASSKIVAAEFKPVEKFSKDMITVLAIGAGGAVLGLSTLSFVEEPTEHFKSILVGFSLGIIIGVAIIAWDQANSSKQMYLDNAFYKNSTKDFSTFQRISWHNKNHVKSLDANIIKNPTMVGYTFSF